MNREEILAMEAGEELDRVISYVFDLPLTEEVADQELLEVYHYSTDISAAWQVVERMMSNKWNWWSEYFQKSYQFSFYREKKFPSHYYFASSKSCCESICKAALLAKLEIGE